MDLLDEKYSLQSSSEFKYKIIWTILLTYFKEKPSIRRTINNIYIMKRFNYNLNKDTIMKISYIFMPIVILSIVLISQVYAQSSNNTLKVCLDLYMKKFDEAAAKTEKFQKNNTTSSSTVNNSTLLKKISTDACVTSYTQTGMFGQFLSDEDQEKYLTASFVKVFMEEKNKLNKTK